MASHIIWDWNGTLFHDIDAVLGATNAVFAPYGLDPLTVEQFRAGYTRPIWTAYERFLGRPLRDGEWEQLDVAYHENYHRLMTSCELDAGARTALRDWHTGGGTQSLLSMWWHDRLVPTVTDYGIAGLFRRIDGLQGAGGGPKAECMAAHVSALVLDPAETLVIGDSVDDADAAAAVGASAVLFTGGMTSRAELETRGVPVVDTLADALAFARP